MTALVMTAVAFTLVPGAAADDVYHSEHMALEPVGSAPLRTGFVENTHANGPAVYAQEIYILNGAAPNTDYEVHLVAYAFDPGCEGAPTDFGSAPLTTNGAGNGRAKRVFRPTDVPAGLRDATTASAGKSAPTVRRSTRRGAPPSRSTDQTDSGGDSPGPHGTMRE